MSGMLPKGWMEVSIGEIAFVSLGKTPSKKDYLSNGSLKVIKFRDVNNGVVDFFNDKTGFVRVDEAVVTSMTELKMWDVLTTSAAHSGENIGKKTAIVTELPEKFERVFFTGELLNVRIPNHFLGFEIVSKMIYYFLSSEAGYKGIQKAVAGVHLTQGRAKGILFPLPPLNEQKRIVAKVDAIMPRIDSAKERLEKIPAILKRFRQSVLTAAVTGKLTEKWREEHPDVKSADVICTGFEIPSNWKRVKLGGLIERIQAGKNFSCPSIPVTSETVGLVKISAVTWEKFNPKETKTVLDKRQIHEELFIQKGDFLISRANTIELVGASVIVDEMNYRIMLSDKVWRVEFKDVLKHYVHFFLKSRIGRDEIESRATGNQASMRNISQKAFCDIDFSLPPLDEQKEIVRQVDKLFALADKVEEHYQKARARVDALAQSVLAKAFRGELVPQDPGDEPAEKLLQRIQEEKAKMETELKTASRSARGTRRNGAKMQHTRPEEKQASEP